MKSIIKLSIFLFFIGCNKNEALSDKKYNNLEETTIKEDFNEFYEFFHADSLFQISRVTFPLKGFDYGQDYNPMIKDDDFRWEKKSWELHMKPAKSDNLKVIFEYKKKSVEETITVLDSGIKIIREYSLIKGKWYLTYYGSQFEDQDGIEVIASLNLDKAGQLFELDLWKINYDELLEIPLLPAPANR